MEDTFDFFNHHMSAFVLVDADDGAVTVFRDIRELFDSVKSDSANGYILALKDTDPFDIVMFTFQGECCRPVWEKLF